MAVRFCVPEPLNVTVPLLCVNVPLFVKSPAIDRLEGAVSDEPELIVRVRNVLGP